MNYIIFSHKQLFRHKFLNDKISKSCQGIQQNGKNLGQKEKQGPGTGLLQTRPEFSLMINVLKDRLTEISFLPLISHLSRTLNDWRKNRGNKIIKTIRKILLRLYRRYNSQYKIDKFKCCNLQSTNIFDLQAAESSVVLCRNG